MNRNGWEKRLAAFRPLTASQYAEAWRLVGSSIPGEVLLGARALLRRPSIGQLAPSEVQHLLRKVTKLRPEKLGNAERWQALWSVTYVLPELYPPSVSRYVYSMARDPESAIRLNGTMLISRLARLGRRRAVEVLQSLRHDGDARVRKNALLGLAALTKGRRSS